MAIIQLPSGQEIDFGESDAGQIAGALNLLKESSPEMFVAEQTEPVGAATQPFEQAATRPFELYEAPQLIESTPLVGLDGEELYDSKQVRALTPEITDLSFRFTLGRMDTDGEKLNYIQEVMGSTEAVAQDSDGSFVIDQALVSPEAREEFGLSDSGIILADRPGYSWYDLIDFTGEAGASLAGGIGASLLVAGTGGWIIPLAAVAAGTGAFKAVDEAVEHLEGYNQQSLGEVGSAVAFEAAMGALGEGVGRAVTKVAGRLFKGKGPKVSEERISELEAGGLSRANAEKAAYEESRQAMNQLISEGGVPSIEVASDKGLVGTMQSLYELILPNRKVAQQNTAFIRKTLDDLGTGKISGEDARIALQQQAESIAKEVEKRFVEPGEAVETTKKMVLGVLEKEMNKLEKAYNPTTGIPGEFEQAAKLASSLYSQATRKLYNQADDLIGDGAAVDAEPILNALNAAENSNQYLKVESALFDRIREVAAEGTPRSGPGTFNLTELQQMKEALRIARGDSELVATQGQYFIDDILRTIETSKADKHASLVQSIDAAPPETKKNLIDGLNQFAEANRLWAKGQDIFNKRIANMVIKDGKDGKYVPNQAILNQIERSPTDPQQLKQFLDAVTPPETVQNLQLTPSKVRVLEEIQDTLTTVRPDGTRVPNMDVGVEELANVQKALADNELIELVEKGTKTNKGWIVPSVNEWVGKSNINKNYKAAYLRDYTDNLESYIQMARSGTSPQALRTTVRDSLAKKWIQNAIQKAPNELIEGELRKSPKAFANQYFALSPAVRKELFGADNVEEMDKVIKDFALSSGRSADDFISNLPNISNQSLREQIAGLKRVTEEWDELNASELLSSIRQGAVTQPGQVAAALLKNPLQYNRLARSIGQEAVEGPNGVRDMVMRNLLDEPFEEISKGGGAAEEFIQSGKWGEKLKRVIQAQNENQALDTILGADTVKSLSKLADDAVKVSDGPMAGTSIAGPARKIAIAGAIMGGVLNPAAAMAAALPLAGIYVLGRLFRNKSFLKLLTSPRIREKEYEAFIKAGGKVSADAARKQSGEAVYFINKWVPQATQILSTGTPIAIAGAGEEESIEEPPPRRQLRQEPPVDSQLQLPDTTPQASLFQQPRPMAPGLTAAEGLRRVEMDKLLGIA